MEFPCLFLKSTFPEFSFETNTTPRPPQWGPQAARTACRKDLPGSRVESNHNDSHKAQPGTHKIREMVISCLSIAAKGSLLPPMRVQRPLVSTEFRRVERHVSTFQSIQSWVHHWDCGAPLEMSIASWSKIYIVLQGNQKKLKSKIRVQHVPTCRDFWGGWLDDELSCKKPMEKLGNSARSKEIQKYTEYQSENHKLHLSSSHFSAIPLAKHITPWRSNSTAHHRASGATLGRTSWI